MKTKHKIILSLIFFILAISFTVIGILLFNNLPDVDTIAYTNPKDSFVATGVYFSFLFAIGCLVGSVISLIYSFTEE